jgi:hypothetical protein
MPSLIGLASMLTTYLNGGSKFPSTWGREGSYWVDRLSDFIP